MESLRQLYRYNAWVNERVFRLCLGLDAARLGEDTGGTFGTVNETLSHLIGVEDYYLIMLRDEDAEAIFGSRESYFQHDLGWFAERVSAVSDGYQALLEECDSTSLGRAFQAPWFDFPMTARDGLLQVVTHSTQHRAQVLSVLGGRGVAVPDVDYVTMIGEKHAAKG